MSLSEKKQLKPLLSIVLFTLTLFTIAFFRLETRRVGYTVLKMSQQKDEIKSSYQRELIRLAKINDPSHLQQLAMSNSALRKAKRGQIIQMTTAGIAVSQ